jgi:hypothetical protein
MSSRGRSRSQVVDFVGVVRKICSVESFFLEELASQQHQ